MAMLPNGNYEEIISNIQHKCSSQDWLITCVEYGWDAGNLYLEVEWGDPFEDGFNCKIKIDFCPFCGYNVKKYVARDAVNL